MDAANQNTGPVGIGGWLILPIANLAIVALIGPYYIWMDYALLPVIVIATFVAVWAYTVLCLVSLFQRRRIARVFVIVFFGLAIAYDVAQRWADIAAGSIDDRTIGQAIIRIAIAAGFIEYFVRSRRVRQTLEN